MARNAHSTATTTDGEETGDIKENGRAVGHLSAFAQKRALDVQAFQYPRASTQHPCLSIEQFLARFNDLGLEPGQEAQNTDPSVIQGRVSAVRTAGGSLCFVDIAEWSADARTSLQKCRIQAVVEKKKLLESIDDTAVGNPIKRLARELKRGDHIRMSSLLSPATPLTL